MFLFEARTFLAELDRFRPAMVEACRRALEEGTADLDFFRLGESGFAACESDSIDYAVMEHTARAAVVPADMAWSDVGSWSALWEIGEKDSDGNVFRGDVLGREVTDSLVRCDHGLAAVLGLEDFVLVVTDDVVLATTRGRAQDVKALAEAVDAAGRAEHLHHTTVHRPWGHYRSVDGAPRFLVKRITVKPGGRLSLQRHRHRAEHWVVVSGVARVTRGEETFLVRENESTYIPREVVHRLENPGEADLQLVEVQTGFVLSEDDIERLDDIYGRGD
jgi:mannose-1-phosphate guanylyltransferase/mannose-6-phosphate isomerase